MGIRIEEFLTCGNNPTGFSVNYGYYALAECILKKTLPSEALLRWCGLRYDPLKPRTYTPRKKFVPYDPELKLKVVEIYKENPLLTNKEIAEIIGRSNTFVSRVLNGIGIKRSRWENYKKGGQDVSNL